MNFLEKGHHASRQKTDLILVCWPKLNRVEFLLKVTNLHNGLGLADVKHLSHQHQSTMNLVACFLIKEREFILVSKERLVGGGGEMILEDVKDQLIDDPQLNLVAADEPFVVILVAVEGNHLALRGIWFERRTHEHGLAPVIPLCELLALGGRHLCPLCEYVNLHAKLDFHRVFAISELSLGAAKQAITLNWYSHEQTPGIILTLVLQEFEESLGGGNGNFNANVIASRLGGEEPAFLIGLLGEIPGLVEGAGDVVVELETMLGEGDNDHS
jgi:hypothetical protein